MNREEYCQNQVEQIDRQLFQVRSQIEHLMQVDEYLTQQRERWVGRIATNTVVQVDFPTKRNFTLIQGGGNDANPSA